MRLLLLGVLLLLCLCSITFSLPAQGTNEDREVTADSEALTDSVINDDADEVEDETKQMQPTTTNPTTDDKTETEEGVAGKRPSERRRNKLDKRVKTSNRYNKLSSNRDKRKRWRKRRPSNSKKGISKTKSKAITEIIPYKLDTQKVNQNVDELLVLVSQYLREGSASNLKLATPPTNIKAKPWGYVVLETNRKTNDSQSIEKIRSKRESDDNENDEEDSELETDDDGELDEDSNDEKEESIPTPVPEDSKSASDFDLEGEQTASNKEEADLTADEDEEDEDDDLFTKDATSLINSTTQDQSAAQYETPVLSRIPQAIKQSDGSQVYHLQLLDDVEASGSEKEANEPNSFKSRALDDVRSARKQGDKFVRSRNQRRFKRPKALVNGLDAIKRSEDVTAGTRNGTDERVYEIPLDVGPVYLTFNESAVFSMPVSRVSTSVLKARLRLKERGGKLMSVKVKAVKMKPNNAVISLKVADEQPMFDDQTARLVTHLSQEMARAWNSGSLLRPVKRSLKHLVLLTGSKADERRVQSQPIKEKAEKLLHEIFPSPTDTTSSTTATPDEVDTSDASSVIPTPSAA